MNNWQINSQAQLQMHSLIMQFYRRATNTTHVGFIPFPRLLVVAYGRIEQGRFRLSIQDEYPYEDYKIVGIHDGVGWNVPMLTGFLAECLQDELQMDALQLEREGKE